MLRGVVNLRTCWLGLVMCLVGCGPPIFVPVSGVVTLDGKPVEGAAVILQQVDGKKDENHISMAATDAAGKFVLMTDEKQGAFIGKYLVSIRKVRTEGMKADPDGLSGTTNPTAIQEFWDTPRKYGRFETSGFTVEIKAEMPPVEFKLVSEKDHSGEDQ